MYFQLRRFLACAMAIAVGAALAPNSEAQITFERIASGLSSPVDVTHAPGDATRLFIVLQGGQIRIYDLVTNTLKPTPFINLSSQLTSGGERGLLGLAFHPDYQSNGYFYVNFTDNSGGDTRVTRYSRTSADTADANSGLKLIEVDQPFSNHNAGWIGFGPDGYLYVSMGDGGSGGDPGNRAQDITNQLLGKMLRLDVDGDDFPGDANKNYAIPADNPFVGATGDDEIFMYGLRNPWRCSFDRETGDLWMGDVGQNAVEEVSFRPADAPGGQYYGWRKLEGTANYNSSGAPSTPDVKPIFQYNQNASGGNGGFSITGGFVYRGPITALHGTYFFADYAIGRIRSFQFDDTTSEASYDGSNYHSYVNWSLSGQTVYSAGGAINNPSSFGEDLDGNLYCCDLSGGEVFRLTEVESQTVRSFAVVSGDLANGDESSLAASDDSDLSIRRSNQDVQSRTQVDVESVSPTTSPGMIKMTVEASVFSRTAVTQSVELFNFSTGSWEVVDSRPATRFTDSTATFAATGNLARFVDSGSSAIRARLSYTSDNNPRQRFTSHVDVFQWTIAD